MVRKLSKDIAHIIRIPLVRHLSYDKLHYMDEVSQQELLTRELHKLNKSFGLYRSFIRGIVTGFGTAVGAGLLVTLVAIIFQNLTGLPVLGRFFAFIANSLF